MIKHEDDLGGITEEKGLEDEQVCGGGGPGCGGAAQKNPEGKGWREGRTLQWKK